MFPFPPERCMNNASCWQYLPSYSRMIFSLFASLRCISCILFHLSNRTFFSLSLLCFLSFSVLRTTFSLSLAYPLLPSSCFASSWFFMNEVFVSVNSFYRFKHTKHNCVPSFFLLLLSFLSFFFFCHFSLSFFLLSFFLLISLFCFIFFLSFLSLQKEFFFLCHRLLVFHPWLELHSSKKVFCGWLHVFFFFRTYSSLSSEPILLLFHNYFFFFQNLFFSFFRTYSSSFSQLFLLLERWRWCKSRLSPSFSPQFEKDSLFCQEYLKRRMEFFFSLFSLVL